MAAGNNLLRESSSARFFNLAFITTLVSYLLRSSHEGDWVAIRVLEKPSRPSWPNRNTIPRI